ncbi:MAG: CotH kinase family protein [Crocinitomicaceae bacterium]|nr:CotH kinase family protein [Crocinitomicaceae bacterium]
MKLLITFAILVSFGARSAVDHWETVVYESDTWRYLVPTSAVTSTWNTLAFNDASWSTGPGGFGYGDGDDATTFGVSASCYQRIIFSITDLSAIDKAIFNIDYDDAFVAYLNGVEITRDNITSVGQPPFSQFSDGLHEAVMYTGGYPNQYTLDAAFLSANLNLGNNVLCIQTHNESTVSSDMSSRAFLSLGINNTSNDYGPTPAWFVPPFDFSSSNLPIVVIDTYLSMTIPDDPKIDATMGIIYNGEGVINNMTDPFNEYNGDIGIERRGSSSGGFAKKQWGLETRDPAGNSANVSIFNMAYDNDWVLYAPYSDKSLLRNVLSYKMGWDTDRYAPRTKLCEVVLNGEYQGVYVFTEKIKRKDGKVGNNDLEPWDVSGNEVTGDYILKVDKTTAGNSTIWTSSYPPYTGAPGLINIQAHDPELDSLVPAQMTYIENVFTAFEAALDGPNFADPVLGYAPFVDMGSYIDFMLVNEFGKNVDGYRISTYFHKKRFSDGGELAAGPLWDFNLAWGNANYCDGGNTAGWEIDFYTICGGGGLQNPFWFEKMVQDPTFAHDMNCRWQEMRMGAWHTDTLMAYVDSMAAYLEEAQTRNFQKWSVLGTYLWPNNYVGATYAEEIAYLKTWITDRAAWMDANMFGTCDDLAVDENAYSRLRVFPNPSDGVVNIEFPTEVSNAQVMLYDATGRVLVTQHLSNTYATKLDVSTLPAGMYTYKVIEDTNHTTTGKLSVN